jgi:hypothetical protein
MTVLRLAYVSIMALVLPIIVELIANVHLNSLAKHVKHYLVLFPVNQTIA